jgi:opacity protein-like surface antigen
VEILPSEQSVIRLLLEGCISTSKALLILLLSCLYLAPAHAAEGNPEAEYQNPFSDYVPFEDEYDVDEDERFMYFGKFFAVGMGSGIQTFGGNIGKLYNTALPVLDAKLIYFFDFRLAGQLGITSSNHAFTADPNGFVEVNIFKANLDLKYYFDTQNYAAAVTAANPYFIAGLSQVYRTQAFNTLDEVSKDNSIAYSAGLGIEFALSPRKTALGVEGRYHVMNFKDRYDQTYLRSGIADTTGPMYSLLTNVIFFF